MTTIYANVDNLVGEVKGETTNIFDQMRGVYNGAMSQALQTISASVENVNTDITEPGTPIIDLDFVTAKNYIDDLQDAFLDRPPYPTFDYGKTPNLPGLSTTPPGLTTVSLPDVPSINMPEFSAEIESEVITLPDVSFDYQEIAYAYGLHDALWNQLLDEISNGGYPPARSLRGIVWWNRTQTIQRDGTKKQRKRPKSDWLRLEAPELRVVYDALWAQGEALRKGNAAAYKRKGQGRFVSRPTGENQRSAYLLSSIAKAVRRLHCGYQ